VASMRRLFAHLIGVKRFVLEDWDYFDAKHVLRIYVRPRKRDRKRCPICHRHCPGYDERPLERRWRSLNCGFVKVEIVSQLSRVCCPEHGVHTEDVCWAYAKSRFTKSFEQEVTWLSRCMSKSALAELKQIDWQTVGRCISRVRHDLEPDIKVRFNGLRIIGVDETSYHKGHKYITTVVDQEKGIVVWAHEGHGRAVLTEFFESLTEEQRAGIEIVAGDGARWITDCAEQYCPNHKRCVDTFHVVTWAQDALDRVRAAAWHKAQDVVKGLKKELTKPKRGRIAKSNKKRKEIQEAIKTASEIKGSSYALYKNPENLTELQQLKLEKIADSNPALFRAYQRKEELRAILKVKDPCIARDALSKWCTSTRRSHDPHIKELGKKVTRHEAHILNTIQYGVTSAQVEALNNKIKVLFRIAYGFRSIENMIDMILLICSNLPILLPFENENLPIPVISTA